MAVECINSNESRVNEQLYTLVCNVRLHENDNYFYSLVNNSEYCALDDLASFFCFVLNYGFVRPQHRALLSIFEASQCVAECDNIFGDHNGSSALAQCPAAQPEMCASFNATIFALSRPIYICNYLLRLLHILSTPFVNRQSVTN